MSSTSTPPLSFYGPTPEGFPPLARLSVERYERMVADPEKEMRGLIEFLGVPWSDDILDNRSAAARRAHIATASYAQVGEELYTRAAGRWVSYARHLEPVMPVLQPWIARLGYDN